MAKSKYHQIDYFRLQPVIGAMYIHVSKDKYNVPCPRDERGQTLISDDWGVGDEKFDWGFLVVLETKQPHENGNLHTWSICRVMNRDGAVSWIEASWLYGDSAAYKRVVDDV